MPRFSKLGALAVLADNMYTKAKVLQRHKKGINVLYGNGAAHWVDLKAFDDYTVPAGSLGAGKQWKTLDENTAFDATSATYANIIFLNDGTWSTGNAGGYGALKPAIRN